MLYRIHQNHSLPELYSTVYYTDFALSDMTVTGPAIPAGETWRFPVSLTNLGPDVLTSLHIDLDSTGDVRLGGIYSTTGGCSFAEGTADCGGLNVASGEVVELELNVQPMTPGVSTQRYTVLPTGSENRFMSNIVLTVIQTVLPSVALTITGFPEQVGQPAPYDYGVSYFLPGTVVTNLLTLGSVNTTNARHTFSNWTGTGSVPATGTDSNLVFTILNDSTLTLNWTTEYSMRETATGVGAFNESTNWYAAGTMASTRLAPDYVAQSGAWHFVEWRLDGQRQPGPAVASTNPVAGILMDRPRVAEAIYSEESQDQDGDGLGDWFELRYFGDYPQTPSLDPDGDGLLNGYEELSHTDPSNPQSGFILTDITSNPPVPHQLQ
ncbi:MAG: hypothetical protein AAF492_26925, partial [Verrucomicrobiota bacterium]